MVDKRTTQKVKKTCPLEAGPDRLFEPIPLYPSFFAVPVAIAQELRSVAKLA